MAERDVIDYLKIFDKNLNDSIRIGFHAHNNMNLAFSNALAFINYQTSRKMTVDSCLLGMGDGAGNLQTELFIDHLNKNTGTVYNYDKILEVCEIIEKYFVNIPWGYSIVNLLSSINKTSYKYSKFLRNEYFLSFTEINFILKNIPEDLRHRYTPENALRLLDLAKAKTNEYL
jgi:4-hydroxy 2-oxovalerate aldolase